MAASAVRIHQRPGQLLGPFVLDSLIGEGAHGAVWKAVQQQPFTRNVAIKILDAAHNSETILRRFQQEQEVLAKLDHPNIVTILGAGTTDAGQPWYAMPLIDGDTLIEHVSRENFTPRQCAAVAATIAESVQFAHDENVLHRDIKPRNILVDTHNRLRIIDFGLARVGESTGTTDNDRTVGSPSHMAPEQATHQPVDAQADVFGIGGTLLHMLTGQPPRDVEGMTLNSALQYIASHRVVVPASIPDDLRAIVSRATSQDPKDRYQSCTSLADDLRRYIARIPPVATEYGSAKRFYRFCLRRPALTGSVAIGILSLVVGSVIVLVLLAAKRDASSNSETSRAKAAFAAAVANHESDSTTAWHYLNTIPDHLRGWEWEILRNRIGSQQTIVSQGESDVLSLALHPSRPLLAAAATTDIRILNTRTGDSAVIETDLKAAVWWSVVWLADGRLAVGENSGWLYLINPDTGAYERLHFDGSVLGLAPIDETTLAVAVGKALFLIDTTTLEVKRSKNVSEGSLYSLARVGDHLLAGDSNGQVLRVPTSLAGPVETADIHSGSILRIVPDATGARIAVTGRDCAVAVLDSDTLDVLQRLGGHRAAVWDAAWVDTDTLLTSSTDYTIREWNLNAQRTTQHWSSPQQHVWSLARAPDGRLWSGGHDGSIREWGETAHGISMPSPIRVLEWSPAGGSLAVVTEDGSTSILSGDALRPLERAPVDARFASWVDESTVCCVTPGGRVVVLDTETNTVLSNHLLPIDRIQAADVRGDALVVASERGSLLCVSLKTGSVLGQASAQQCFPESDPSRWIGFDTAAISPDGKRVAAGLSPHKLTTLSMPDLHPITVALSPIHTTYDLRWSQDGSRLLVCGSERPGNVALCDSSTLESLTAFHSHANTASGCVWHPDLNRFVSIGHDGRAIIWSPDSPIPVMLVLDLEETRLTSLAINPISGQLAIGADDGTIHQMPQRMPARPPESE